MTTSANFLTTAAKPEINSLYGFKRKQPSQTPDIEHPSDECIWQNFLVANRIIHLLRPDFFMIYKFSKSTILYEHNINLDLHAQNVTTQKIMQYLTPGDLDHIRSIDKIMIQVTTERKLQPLDYVYRICGNMECPNTTLKRILRTSFLIHSNAAGMPELGFFCFHDVSTLFSSIRPKNYDISFDYGHEHLKDEVMMRLQRLKLPQTIITPRELDILRHIDKGMSSKEIASCLFISKTTVDTHRQNMLRKWDLPNTAALLKRAREEDWI